MVTPKQIDQETRDKVNRIDQRVEEVVLPALEEMRGEFKKLNVVKQSEFVDYKNKTDKRIADLEAARDEAIPAVKFFNLLNSRWTNLLVGGIIVAAIYAVVSQITKIGVL